MPCVLWSGRSSGDEYFGAVSLIVVVSFPPSTVRFHSTSLLLLGEFICCVLRGRSPSWSPSMRHSERVLACYHRFQIVVSVTQDPRLDSLFLPSLNITFKQRHRRSIHSHNPHLSFQSPPRTHLDHDRHPSRPNPTQRF